METKNKPMLLRVLLALFIMISFLIIGLNHYTLDKILTKSAEKTLTLTANNTSERIANYLKPIIYRVSTAASLIKEEAISPGNNPNFMEFLHDMLTESSSINAAYFADDTGNFYLLKRNKDQYIGNVITRRKDKVTTIETLFDAKMNLVDTKVLPTINYDPRTKLWFKDAVMKKGFCWYFFPNQAIGGMSSEIGQAGVTPIYDRSDNFIGVFGVNALLGGLSTYLRDTEAYPNSIIIVNDDIGQVLSAYAAKMDLTNLDHMQSLNDLHIPWVQVALNKYKQDKQSIFKYSFKGEKYIAVVEPVQNIRTDHEWYVTIITPFNDIIKPSKINFILTIVAAISFILIALIAAKLMTS